MVVWKRALVLLLIQFSGPVAVRAQQPVEYLVRLSDPASKLYEVEAILPAAGDTTLATRMARHFGGTSWIPIPGESSRADRSGFASLSSFTLTRST